MAEPHVTKHIHWVQHDLPDAHVELVRHGEPLLRPHKLPSPSTQLLQELIQVKVTFTIAEGWKREETLTLNALVLSVSQNSYKEYKKIVKADTCLGSILVWYFSLSVWAYKQKICS